MAQQSKASGAGGAAGMLRNLSRTSVLMIVMFLAGAAWIYFRNTSIDTAIQGADKGENPVVDAGIMQMQFAAKSAAPDVKFGALLEKASLRREDFQKEEIKRNIFQLEFVESAADDNNKGGAKENGGKKPETRPGTAAVEPAGPSMEGLGAVRMIIYGPNPRAFVGSRMVKTGDSLGEWRVREIRRGGVVVEWKKDTNEVRTLKYGP